MCAKECHTAQVENEVVAGLARLRNVAHQVIGIRSVDVAVHVHGDH